MLYVVGTHIDLSQKHQPAASSERSNDKQRLYEAGTSFSFIRTLSGLIVTNITEPTIALRVQVGA